MRRRLSSALLATIALAAGCADGRGPAFVSRDSAGVIIAESHRPAWGDRAEWTIDSLPAVTIRAWSPPRERDSFHLADAGFVPGGEIVVANGATGQLGFFDRRGTLLRLTGGRGTEPGRFETLRSVHLIQGQLWAFDSMGRWNVFDLEGGLVASMYLEPHGGSWSRVEPYGEREMAVLSGASCCPPTADGSGFLRPEQPILRYVRGGRILDTLTTVPGFEMLVLGGNGWGHRIPSLYAPRPVLHGGSTLLYVGSGERMEILAYAEGGRLARVIRIPDYDLGLSDEAWFAEEARIRDILRARAARGERERDPRLAGVPDIPRHDTRPAYAGFVADALGHLWVREHDAATAFRRLASAARWTVFDPEGRWLGSMETPAGLTVTEIGPDYVIGLAHRDGRSVAEVYRLAR